MSFRVSERYLGVALLAVAIALGGCSSNSLIRPSGPSAAEIEELRYRNVELQKQATVGRVEMTRLQREVAELEAELEALRQSMGPRTPTPMPDPLSGTASGSTTAAEPAVTADPEIEEIDLEDEPIIAKPIVETPPTPHPVQVPTAATPQPGSATPSTEAQSLYDEGYTLFHQNNYTEAEARFQRFVDRYPETELADNALFWIGETRYARGDFSSALEAFTNTVERFPQGNKVADALLKAGKCLETLGDQEQALATYQEVTRRYPGTAAAAQAADKLDALRK